MKKIKLLTTVLLTACVLAGCGNQDEEPATASGPITLDPVPIGAVESNTTPEESAVPDSSEPEATATPVAATATIG